MRLMYGKRSATVDRLKVLYDGWPLARLPGSPAALHLLEIFEALPPQVDPWLALPEREVANLPAGIQTIASPARVGIGGRLRWEQSSLPALMKRSGAKLLHTTSKDLPLFQAIPCLVSPAEEITGINHERGAAERLRAAFGRGGLVNARALLWPEDLPAPDLPVPILPLPPRVHSAFFEEQPNDLRLPENYVLASGLLNEREITLLAAAWSWITAGLGDDWHLVVHDASSAAMNQLFELCQGMGTEATVTAVALQTPQERAAAYQQAGVVLQVGTVYPWGDPLLQALACGRPLASLETALSDARVGPAGYLVKTEDPAKLARALGAAVLTPLVEEPVAERLSSLARQRTEGWGSGNFGQRLGKIYEQVCQ